MIMKKKLAKFLEDPIVRETYKEEGTRGVAHLASVKGNLEKDGDFRRLAESLSKPGASINNVL